MSKSKRRLNVVDIVIVLLLAGSVFIVGYVIGIFGGATSSGEDRMVYFTIEMTYLREDFVELISVGDSIRDSVRGDVLGVVDSFTVAPTDIATIDRVNAEFIMTIVPERYTVLLTVRGRGTETESRIAVEGNNITVGQMMSIRGKGYAGMGFITTIRTEQEV